MKVGTMVESITSMDTQNPLQASFLSFHSGISSHTGGLASEYALPTLPLTLETLALLEGCTASVCVSTDSNDDTSGTGSDGDKRSGVDTSG